MSDPQLDEQIMSAVRAGKSTRAELMQVSQLRIRTWSVVCERINHLCKRGMLISNKSGWQLPK